MTIFTLGSSTRPWEEFLEVLRAYGVRAVADVRRFPTSSRYPHFSKQALASALPEQGIAYHHLEALGGFRTGGYEAYTRTEAFGQALAELEWIARESPTAVLCAERFPWRCHRSLISRRLEERGWEVVHIIERDRTWQPEKEPRQLKLGCDRP